SDVTRTCAINGIVAVAADPFSETVMVPVASARTAPVPTPKPADVSPAGTVTDAGTCNGDPLEVIETALPPLNAGLDNVILQLPPAFGPSDAGVHCNPVTSTGATSDTFVDVVLPFKEAVIVAVVSEGTGPAAIAKRV